MSPFHLWMLGRWCNTFQYIYYCSWKEHWFQSQWIQILPLMLAICVTLGKSSLPYTLGSSNIGLLVAMTLHDFSLAVPYTWNSLPSHPCLLAFLVSFKTQLKCHLLQRGPSWHRSLSPLPPYSMHSLWGYFWFTLYISGMDIVVWKSSFPHELLELKDHVFAFLYIPSTLQDASCIASTSYKC